MGQTIRDKNGTSYPNNGPLGTATWEVGAVQNLPDIYGMITYTAYQQPKNETITITVNPQCYDTGAKCRMPNKYSQCSATMSVPIVVLPAATPPAEVEQLRKDYQGNKNDALFTPEERKKNAARRKKATTDTVKNTKKK
jgi:hypothetical protein